MRELLVTITLLSVVSSQESEHKKRIESPPEVDPNFWPVRGRRSYWDVEPSRFLNNLNDEENNRPDEISHRDTDYAGFTSSSQKPSRYRPGPEEIIFDRGGELRGFFDARRRDSCPQNRPISLVVPLRNYRVDEIGSNFICEGHYGGRNGGDGGRGGRGGGGGGDSDRIRKSRRGEEDRSRRLEPLYVDEPGWIEIDYSNGNYEKDRKNEDPFFIARGKKIHERGGGEDGDYGQRQIEEILEAYTGGPFFVARGKKQTFDEEGLTDPEYSRYEKYSPSFKRYQKLKFDSKIDSTRYAGGWNRRIRRGISSGNKEKEERERDGGGEGGRGGGEGGEKEVEAEKFSRDLQFSDKSLTKDKNSVNFHEDNDIENGAREAEEKGEEEEYQEGGGGGGGINVNVDEKYRNNIKKKNNNEEKIVADITNGIKLPSSSSEVLHRLSARGILADYEPRNSATQRDKHSNLQSILDEPFFISRGKKGGGVGYRDVGYLREVRGDELPIKMSASPRRRAPPPPPTSSSSSSSSSSVEREPVMISDILKIYRGRETSSSYYRNKKKDNYDDDHDDDDDDDDEDNKNNFEERENNVGVSNYDKFNEHQHDHHYNQYRSGNNLSYKLGRNRRGMLDDLLKSDDPFYVARGKRLEDRRPVITNYRIDDGLRDPKSTVSLSAVKNLSIFFNTLMHRTKLPTKFPDFAKPINY